MFEMCNEVVKEARQIGNSMKKKSEHHSDLRLKDYQNVEK